MPLEEREPEKCILSWQEQIRSPHAFGFHISWYASRIDHTEIVTAIGKGLDRLDGVIFPRRDHQPIPPHAGPLAMALHACRGQVAPAKQIRVVTRAEFILCMVAAVGTDAERIRVIEKSAKHFLPGPPVIPGDKCHGDVKAEFLCQPKKLRKIYEPISFLEQRIIDN